MKNKMNSPSAKRGEIKAGDELDELNARARGKVEVTSFMEATIETKAKKRRNQESPSSSAWKPA
jgi:hypothetical protein